MNVNDIQTINNLVLRYQNYDMQGRHYSYTIQFKTLQNDGLQMKAERQMGADNFYQHINQLTQEYQGVTTIMVTDHTGKSRNSKELNPPTEIVLIDVKKIGNNPQALISTDQPAGNRADVFQGLHGLFAGTEFEGLGSLAPIAKFIDDKHKMERMNEKAEDMTKRIAELEHKNSELSRNCDTLSKRCEQLQDETDEMEEELDYYRGKEDKRDKWASMIGMAGASIAKTFLKKNPGILSGFIPADQLAGILSDDEEPQPVQPAELSPAEQTRLDATTAIFEWLQTLEQPVFDNVMAIMELIRQNPDYAAYIVNYLRGNNNQQSE